MHDGGSHGCTPKQPAWAPPVPSPFPGGLDAERAWAGGGGRGSQCLSTAIYVHGCGAHYSQILPG